MRDLEGQTNPIEGIAIEGTGHNVGLRAGSIEAALAKAIEEHWQDNFQES